MKEIQEMKYSKMCKSTDMFSLYYTQKGTPAISPLYRCYQHRLRPLPARYSQQLMVSSITLVVIKKSGLASRQPRCYSHWCSCAELVTSMTVRWEVWVQSIRQPCCPGQGRRVPRVWWWLLTWACWCWRRSPQTTMPKTTSWPCHAWSGGENWGGRLPWMP